MNEKRLWESDLGDGFFKNPVLFTDYSDPDVIRVGDTYYMTASSFSCIPGLPILVSKDLINWDLVNYALRTEIPWPGYENPQHGKGIWAPSIRYHDGKFHIFVGMPDEGVFVTSAEDPYGEWGPLTCIREGKGFIDPCPVWAGDGRAYVVHGYANSRIGIKSMLGVFEITPDCAETISEDKFVFDGNEGLQPTIEGPKVYIKNGYYYILSPAGGVRPGWQTALRSKDIYGPYEQHIVMHQGAAMVNGPHQGALVDTPDGKEEWFMHFQDRGVYGRICHLQKVTWEEGWPVMGIHQEALCGEPSHVYRKPSGCPKVVPHEADTSDDFANGRLGIQWQWMANAREEYISFPEGKQCLRLWNVNPTGVEHDVLWHCGNLLTQKIVCPAFVMETKFDVSRMPIGAKAGVLMLGGEYIYLALNHKEDGFYAEYAVSSGSDAGQTETVVSSEQFKGDLQNIILKVIFRGDGTCCLQMNDGGLTPRYVPGKATWTGAKTGVFAVDGKVRECAGYVDVEYVHVTAMPEDYRGDDGLHPLFLAAREGNPEMVKRLVEYSKYSMNDRDSKQRGALHYAAMSGNPELVRYLVEQVGMSPVEGDADRITPYEIAHKVAAAAGEFYEGEIVNDIKGNFVCMSAWRTIDGRNRRESLKAGRLAVEAYLTQAVGAPYESMYHNPIRTGAFPDPSIVRVGEDYYMVNSSFTYFPCIPISHSRDLVHWEIIGHAITDPEWSMLEGLESGRAYWAPDISYDGYKFYITATYRMNDTEYLCRRQIVVSADKPEGPYSKPAIIDEDGIDPSIFHDDNGRKYMLLNRGARILELSSDCKQKMSDAELIWYGDMQRAPEGPHVLKKDGYYYLIVAEGGTGMGHRVSVARSKYLKGPYESCPYNPIMRQQNPNAAIQRCGHGKLVQTQKGEWYMVYLCGRLLDNAYTVIGRETAMDPVTWTADGWPVVNGLKGPSVLQKFPDLPRTDKPAAYVTDTFFTRTDGEVSWNKNWMWVKLPKRDGTIAMEDGGIRLLGGAPLYEVAGSQVMVTRQTEFAFTARVDVRAYCPCEGQEAGMTCYYDENTYLTFGVMKKGDGVVLAVRERIGSVLKTSFETPAAGTDYTLWVETDGLVRSFWYQEAGRDPGDRQRLGTLERVNYLCDEGWHIGKRFTGAMVGVYAVTGTGEKEAHGEFSHVNVGVR